MALQRGTQVGSCEILDLLGSGGMGEVYRGRDTKLGRDVAVKALPDAFAHDTARLARFEREAQVLASLNHPNIAMIHDLKEAQGAQYLILELVEGETLAERIARGPIPVDQALHIAGQIADALEAAHDKGVVHRDLKPANVKITPEGRVKVLDFGLAKIQEPGSGMQNVSHSPTLSALQTAGGVILGTAAYMSPEQARGKDVDRRADVWAFGCVLYEMLTGRQTFPNGETVSDTLAGILARDPDWRALPPGIPPGVRGLLEKCLRKDPERRLRDIGDARVQIEEIRAESGARAALPREGRRRELVLALVALVFFLTTAAGAARVFFRPLSSGGAIRMDLVEPAQNGFNFDLSPDGRKIAFITGALPRLIWVRELESGAAQSIPSTDPVDSTGSGEGFFWSPDSQYLGFVTQDGKLKKVPAGGGTATELAKVPPNPQYYGTWSPSGVILLGSDIPGPLLRVPEGGGEPKPATELDASRKEQSHRYPHFLPDGRHFLYLASGADAGDRRTYVGELDSKERRPLEGISGQAKYANGHVVFVRDGALMAQPFDADGLQLTGDAFAVVNPIASATDLAAPFSVSTTRRLTYFTRGSRGNNTAVTQLFWFDRTGVRGDAASPAGEYLGPELSHDGKLVAFARGTPRGISVLEIDKQNIFPLTSGKTDDLNPRWSPNDKTIAFQSARDGGSSIYTRAVGVVGEDKRVLKSDAPITLSDWSPDGKYLIYVKDNDVWALPYSDDAKAGEAIPKQITKTPEVESLPRVSWDGRWIAFMVVDGGAAEVWVQSFPDPGERKKVSIDGGGSPRWSRDSKELFYYSVFPNTVMSVAIKVSGSSLTAAAPVALVPRSANGTNVLGIASSSLFLLQITPAPTSAPGARGAPATTTPPGSTQGIHMIFNWPAAFSR